MLTRRMPERRMSTYRSPVDWLFDDPWADGGQWSMAMMPSIDMRETDDAYVLEAELPGVKPEDIDVTLDGRTLIIQGRYGTDEEKGSKEGRYLVHERRSGTFTRGVTLPGAIDAERIDSEFENGELTVTLPKAAEARTRRIPISAGAHGAKQVGSSGSEGGGRSSGGGSQG